MGLQKENMLISPRVIGVFLEKLSQETKEAEGFPGKKNSMPKRLGGNSSLTHFR